MTTHHVPETAPNIAAAPPAASGMARHPTMQSAPSAAARNPAVDFGATACSPVAGGPPQQLDSGGHDRSVAHDGLASSISGVGIIVIEYLRVRPPDVARRSEGTASIRLESQGPDRGIPRGLVAESDRRCRDPMCRSDRRAVVVQASLSPFRPRRCAPDRSPSAPAAWPRSWRAGGALRVLGWGLKSCIHTWRSHFVCPPRTGRGHASKRRLAARTGSATSCGRTASWLGGAEDLSALRRGASCAQRRADVAAIARSCTHDLALERRAWGRRCRRDQAGRRRACPERE